MSEPITLTEAEREALRVGVDRDETGPGDSNATEHVTAAVERIIAARLAEVTAERDRLRDTLLKIHGDHQRQTETWNHRDSLPTELAARWHDGYVTACATHAIEAKKGLDPEGAAEDDETWRIGAEGTDSEWYRLTGHCGRCGDVATNCGCAGQCGCFAEHGPRKEPWISPESRANEAEAENARLRAALARVETLADEWERPGPKVQGTPEAAADTLRGALAGGDS